MVGEEEALLQGQHPLHWRAILRDSAEKIEHRLASTAVFYRRTHFPAIQRQEIIALRPGKVAHEPLVSRLIGPSEQPGQPALKPGTLVQPPRCPTQFRSRDRRQPAPQALV